MVRWRSPFRAPTEEVRPIPVRIHRVFPSVSPSASRG
ncbi:hypothetical protein SFR_1757 [Streptomyces sp. FR-008]|nr:hypothetical protein SFR_1757 [Streptomyces sp. FR-008]